jgi:hypothetical protein
MAQVYRYALPRTEQAVLLAFAEHAKDATTPVWPGIGRIAWMTGLNRRTVALATQRLVKRGALVETRPATWHYPAHYRIALSALHEKPPYVSAGKLKSDVMEADLPSGPPVVSIVTERWHRALARLSGGMPMRNFETWFNETWLFGERTVVAPNDFARDWLRARYGPAIASALGVPTVDVVVVQEEVRSWFAATVAFALATGMDAGEAWRIGVVDVLDRAMDLAS